MLIEKEEKGDVVILRIVSEKENSAGVSLDFNHTALLRAKLNQLLEEGKVKVLLDLGSVFSICSIAIGVFVAFSRSMRDRGGDLKFLNLTNEVKRIFCITMLARIFDIFYNEEEVLAAFQRNESEKG